MLTKREAKLEKKGGKGVYIEEPTIVTLGHCVRCRLSLLII